MKTYGKMWALAVAGTALAVAGAASADEGFRPTDMRDIRVRAGSALDLSGIPENGRYHGYLAYWGSLMRLFETDATPETRTRVFAEYVTQMRRQGFNMIRLASVLDVANGWQRTVTAPGYLDDVDLFVSELERQGVRIFLDITGGSLLQTNAVNHLAMKSAVMAKAPREWAMWTNCTERILGRRNAYTGRTLAEDPNLLGVMPFNEQATGAKLQLLLYWKRLPEDVKVRYREILGGDPAHFYEAGAQGRAHHLRLSELFAARAADYRQFIRSLGGRMPISVYNSNIDLGACAARWQEADLVTYNFHFAHPQRGIDNPGAFFMQGSSLTRTANGDDFCYGNRIRLADRPFAVSELSQAYPNARRFETAMLPAAYAALNGYQTIMWHEGAVELEAEGPWPRGKIDVFKVATSPIARAQAFLTSVLFRRGDVKTSPHEVQILVSNDYWRGHSAHAPSTAQAKIGLLAKCGLVFPDLSRPAGLPPVPKADLTYAPDRGDEIVDGEFVTSAKGKETGAFDMDACVATMKARGILAPDNISSPKDGVFQSDTGEIVLRGKEAFMSVVTPLTEAVCLNAGMGTALGKLRIARTSRDACIAVTSMDGKPLGDSRRMTFLFITRESNTGFAFEKDGKTVKTFGSYPALLETGRLAASLRLANADGLKLWLLGYNGERLEELPLQRTADGVRFVLDTSRTVHGPTPFFELAPAEGRRELFNGHDLTGWHTYLQGRGRNVDPKGVFAVTNGVLRISGEEWGSLVTEEDFSDYRLTVEYRWLGTAFGDKRDAAPDSGILFHSVGSDGGFDGIWMASHELNLIRGATGDFWTVHPKGSDMFLCAEVSATEKAEDRLWREDDGSRRIRHFTYPVWCAGGRAVKVTGNARICRGDIARDWTDTPETALAVNENPMGTWNTATLECRGDRVRAFFNGKLVNEATHVRPSRGRIQLQSEGCGVEFRRVTLEPLAAEAR